MEAASAPRLWKEIKFYEKNLDNRHRAPPMILSREMIENLRVLVKYLKSCTLKKAQFCLSIDTENEHTTVYHGIVVNFSGAKHTSYPTQLNHG